MRRLEIEALVPVQNAEQEQALASAVRRFKEHLETILCGTAFKISAHVKESASFSMEELGEKRPGSPFSPRHAMRERMKESARERLRQQGIEPKEGQSIMHSVKVVEVEEDGNPGS